MRRINAIYLSAILILVSAQTSHAVEVEGTFTGVVTLALDPGQASFGRDPALWIGETVTGTFSYDIETPGIIDTNPAEDIWRYADPEDNIVWIKITATIDGQEFETIADISNPPGTNGANVVVYDTVDFDEFRIAVSVIPTGRSLIGFNASGPPDSFTYVDDGTGIIDWGFDATTPGAGGFGQIDDLFVVNGTVERDGLIVFNLTSLSFGRSLEQLVEDLLESVSGAGPGRSLSDKMAAVQAYIEAEDFEAACELLNAFENQVSAQSGKKLAEAEADQILGSAEEIREQLSCISR